MSFSHACAKCCLPFISHTCCLVIPSLCCHHMVVTWGPPLTSQWHWPLSSCGPVLSGSLMSNLIKNTVEPASEAINNSFVQLGQLWKQVLCLLNDIFVVHCLLNRHIIIAFGQPWMTCAYKDFSFVTSKSSNKTEDNLPQRLM